MFLQQAHVQCLSSVPTAAHLYSTRSLLHESAWRLTPSRIVTFLSLTLAALMASLMLLTKPVPSDILKDGVGRLPGTL
jgi:hypothetical protein